MKELVEKQKELIDKYEDLLKAIHANIHYCKDKHGNTVPYIPLQYIATELESVK